MLTEEIRLKENLLSFVWQHSLYDTNFLYTRFREKAIAVSPGRRNFGEGPRFLQAEIRLGEKTFVGNVAIHRKASDWAYSHHNTDPAYDGVILLAVEEDDRLIRRIDDSVLPVVVLQYPETLKQKYRALTLGSQGFACASFLKTEMKPVEVKNACTRLMTERLERKYNDILEIHRQAENDWHETFHILLFRSMGLGSNKEAFMALARNVPYAKLCQEKGDIRNLEAMLFGGAGLLDGAVYDPYKSDLEKRFETLSRRHGLQALSYCSWSSKKVRPYNFPPKRIAELAKLIDAGTFTLNNILSCESVTEVKRLFDIELSDYWKRNFSFGQGSARQHRAVGDITADLVVINHVAPLMFAYGRQTGEAALEERALDLLYQVKAEANKYTSGWTKRGITIENAFHSQAFIQLATEYCLRRRCCECFIGIKALKKI